MGYPHETRKSLIDNGPASPETTIVQCATQRLLCLAAGVAARTSPAIMILQMFPSRSVFGICFICLLSGFGFAPGSDLIVGARIGCGDSWHYR